MTNWQERPQPGEQELFERIGRELRALQRAGAQRRGMTLRAVHAKQHVGVEGRLEVADVPEELRVGPFAEANGYRCYVRFSNGAPGRGDDRRPDARGIAVKVVGVPGKKLIPGLEDAVTQDFLFIQNPALPVRDPAGFFALQKALFGNPALLPLKLVGALGPFEALRTIKLLTTTNIVRSMATSRFFTAAPIRLGRHAAKLDLVPLARDAPRGAGRDALREDLVARLRDGEIAYRMRAQLFVDERVTPIEDASIVWPESRAPFVELARLVIPKQDPEKLTDVVEKMSFDPWHATDELRPLGAIMRARRVAYRESVLERGASPEPSQ